jgi:hypothetical protein
LLYLISLSKVNRIRARQRDVAVIT